MTVKMVVRITMATVEGEHQTTLVGVACNEYFTWKVQVLLAVVSIVSLAISF